MRIIDHLKSRGGEVIGDPNQCTKGLAVRWNGGVNWVGGAVSHADLSQRLLWDANGDPRLTLEREVYAASDSTLRYELVR